MIFVVTPPGHEIYMRELGELMARPGPPGPDRDRRAPRPQ